MMCSDPGAKFVKHQFSWAADELLRQTCRGAFMPWKGVKKRLDKLSASQHSDQNSQETVLLI